MAKKRLAGQRALVTGASSGIGAEIAKHLAREGANLIITARRKERLEALATELRDQHGVDVKVEAVDLAVPDAAVGLFERTEGAGVAVDVLVNNAGFGAYESFRKIPWEKHQGLLQVNVVALTHLAQLFLPKMVERGHGHIMNVASIGAYLPCPTFAVYAASKAYVRNFTEALDFELKRTGVKAICVCPGGTKTEFMDAANQELKATAEPFMMTAERCARIAVKKMLRGRRNVITGYLNNIMMWALRFVPRKWMPFLGWYSMASGVDIKQPTPAIAGAGAAGALPGPAAEAKPAEDGESKPAEA